MRILPSALSIMLVLLALTISGCSGSPVSPDTVTGRIDTVREGQNTHRCMGINALIIDTEALEIAVIPARTGQLHLNVTNVLNATMGVGAAGVPSEHDPANGIFVFDITLTHPFGSKPQLTGFDVKGVLITAGSLVSGPLVFADADETRLLNADGYTRWWNPTEFGASGWFGYTQGNLANALASSLTATINPYKYFADILYPDQNMSPVHGAPLDADGGRGVFTAGESNTRRYRIKFPMNPGPQVMYGYAVDVSWEQPSPNPPVEIPDDFPINANEPEPYDVTMYVAANTLYYDSESGHSGGQIRLETNVYDWQGQLMGDISGEADTVKAYAPALYTGGVDCSFVEESSIRAKYRTDFGGLAVPAASGEAVIAVEATSSGGETYEQGMGPAPSDTVASWNAVVIDVIDPECTADPNNDWMEAYEYDYGDYIVDQLCVPTDYRDFFKFSIPGGSVTSGELVLWCDLTSGTLGIYDMDEELVAEANLTGGQASIDLELLDLMPAEYYIRVYSMDDSFPAPYLIEFTGELVNVEPSNPVRVTTEGLYCDPDTVYWEGNYMYLAGIGGLWAYDMADPGDPQEVSYSEWLTSSDIIKYGNTLYCPEPLTQDQNTLNLIDVTDPALPVKHDEVLTHASGIDTMIMNSEHLYIAANDINPGNTTVTIYDWATDPLNPVQVGEFDVPELTIQHMRIFDPEGPETALIVGFYGKLYAYEVEIPTAPVLKGTYNFSALHDMEIEGNMIYCTGSAMTVSEGFFVVGYTPSIGFGPRSAEQTTGYPGKLDVDFPYVYIADGSSGVTVFDVTDSMAMVDLGTQVLVSKCLDVGVYGDYLCAIPEGAGFEVLDVTNPSALVSLYLTSKLNNPHFGFKHGDYFIVNDADTEYWAIKTLDVSDPENVTIAAEIPLFAHNPNFLEIPAGDLGVVAGGVAGHFWTCPIL